MQIIKFYETNNIPYHTEGKNVTEGWINIQCPFCGDQSNHLGFDPSKNTFNCWRCGRHGKVEVIRALLSCSKARAIQILHEFGGSQKSVQKKIEIRRKSFQYPSSTSPLEKQHKKYLRKRNFDPDKLEGEWGLLGTGPVSFLDKKDYKHRIIIPIEYEKRVVSFQGRDITNRSDIRYKACPKDRELVHHKEILYGLDKAEGTAVVVEGVTDVWRLGPGSVATFGIEFTESQISCLVRFKKVFIMFDDEPQAQKQARRLRKELLVEGVPCEIVTVSGSGDPGGLEQEEADRIMKKLIG